MSAKRLYAALSDDAGASVLFVAVVAALLLAIVGIVLNAGFLYAERRSMQTAADAAALAGVQELPANPANARAIANQYVSANPGGTEASNRTYTISSTYIANDTITAHIWQPAFALTLSQFLGRSSAPVGARATAVVGSPSAYSRRVMPFGMMSSNPATGAGPWGYTFNQTYTLKQGSQTSTATGNFQLIDFPGTSDLKKVVSGGGAPASAGETVQSHPGDVAALMKTLDAYVSQDSHTFSMIVSIQPDGTVKISDYTCPHLIIVPVVWSPGPPASYSWADLNGKSSLQILGLAWMWVDSAQSAQGPQGQATITGRFIRPLTPEEVSQWGPPDPYGGIGYRLTD